MYNAENNKKKDRKKENPLKEKVCPNLLFVYYFLSRIFLLLFFLWTIENSKHNKHNLETIIP